MVRRQEMTAPSAGLRERLEAVVTLLQRLDTDHKPVDDAITTLTEALAALAKREADAERWRQHRKVMLAAREIGGLWVRLTMQPEASRTDKIWCNEFVIGTNEMADGPIRNRIIGMKTADKAEELFRAIDAARAASGKGGRDA